MAMKSSYTTPWDTIMETILKAYDNMPNVQSQMLTSQLGLPRRHGRILVRLSRTLLFPALFATFFGAKA